MINNRNIADYINFLHLKKHSYPADADLKNRWQKVPEAALQNQLRKLYQHWQISEQAGMQYEREFLASVQLQNSRSQYNLTSTTPTSQHPQQANHNTPPDYQRAHAPRKKSPLRSILIVLFIATFFGLIAVGVFYYLYQKNRYIPENNDASVLSSSSVINDNAAAIPESQPYTTDTTASSSSTTSEYSDEITNELASRTAVIKDLLKQETERNLGGILSHFSSNITRYWDLRKPTESQLKDRYYNTWSITEDNNYKNVNIERVDENQYNLYTEYSYYSIKDQTEKTISTKTRFVFDENGKIISTYGL